MTAGRRPTRRRAPRSPTPPTTSITSRRSPASITSVSAATSTASRAFVQGLEDVSTYPALTAELLRRGYTDDEVKKILGLNILRVMRKVGESVGDAAEGTRASPMLLRSSGPQHAGSCRSRKMTSAAHPHRRASATRPLRARRGSSRRSRRPRRARRRDEPVRVLADAARARLGGR